MTVKSNTVTITVGNGGSSGTCNCPTMEICANADGTCPAGSFPDNYNPRCCIPCSQLIPNSIENINVTAANVFGYMNVYDNSVHPSCGSCYTSCKTSSTQIFYFTVSGKLVDSDGHGICNTNINIIPSNYGNLEAVVNYDVIEGIFPGTATVTWQLNVGSGNAQTDSNGNFSASVGVTITQVLSATIPDAMNYGCYAASNPSVIPFLLNIQVANTTVTMPASGTVNFYSAISKPL